jgi:hypothetical protein
MNAIDPALYGRGGEGEEDRMGGRRTEGALERVEEYAMGMGMVGRGKGREGDGNKNVSVNGSLAASSTKGEVSDRF